MGVGRVVINGQSGQAPIRHTMESLLREQRRAEETIAAEAEAVKEQMTRVAEQVHQSTTLPQGRTTADEIHALAERTGPVFAAAARDTSAAFAHEVHALLDLLAVNHHDRDPLPPLDTAAIGGPHGIAAAFPEGYARNYITTVTDELEAGGTTSKTAAKAQPETDPARITSAKDQIIAATTPANRPHVEQLLGDPGCHSVELHGPYITEEELELRVGWTRPPNLGTQGADKWRVRESDGRVKSEHRLSHEAAAFTTPEAFARPLDTFLDTAHQHPDGLDGFLDQHAADGRASFFISADQAGLRPGDTVGYRGAGTDTPDAARDWVMMRADAMRADSECLDPVRTLPFEPVVESNDAGARFVFTKGDNGWAMTTYYPAREPGPDNVRLETTT